MRQERSFAKYTHSVLARSIREADNYTRRAIGELHGTEHNPGMKNLRRIRETKKLSQSVLAEMVGVRQATISRIESGTNDPSISVANAIADALEVEVVELFGLPELEQRILQSFREASPERRAALLTLLETDKK